MAIDAADIKSSKMRNEWLGRLSDLIKIVTAWATELGWSTRKIQKSMHDSEIGDYDAPALLLQFETERVLLEPVGRSAPGADGVVDLYVMPAYDDIATLFLRNGVWQVHYLFPDSSARTVQEAPPEPLSKQTLENVLGEMRKNARETV